MNVIAATAANLTDSVYVVIPENKESVSTRVIKNILVSFEEGKAFSKRPALTVEQEDRYPNEAGNPDSTWNNGNALILAYVPNSGLEINTPIPVKGAVRISLEPNGLTRGNLLVFWE